MFSQDQDGTGFRTKPVPSWSCSQAVSCWWWTEELSETYRVFFFQKQIWEISASNWFYYKNVSRCTVTWTLNYQANKYFWSTRNFFLDLTSLQKLSILLVTNEDTNFLVRFAYTIKLILMLFAVSTTLHTPSHIRHEHRCSFLTYTTLNETSLVTSQPM